MIVARSLRSEAATAISSQHRTIFTDQFAAPGVVTDMKEPGYGQ
jgi:hypothetical protein